MTDTQSNNIIKGIITFGVVAFLSWLIYTVNALESSNQMTQYRMDQLEKSVGKIESEKNRQWDKIDEAKEAIRKLELEMAKMHGCNDSH